MKSIYAAAALGAALILGACERTPSQPSELEPSQALVGTLPFPEIAGPLGAGTYPTMNRALAAVRQATAQYHDVNVALANGYHPISPCVALPGVGGMGFHYGKMDLLMDADFSPTEPEALLYEPQPNGTLKLVGVEYVVVQDAWHGSGKTGIPHLLGQPFDVSPANPEAGIPATYALHAWIWQPNPAGTFAPFNPRVSCPVEHDGGDHSSHGGH